MVESVGDCMIPILYESTELAFTSNGIGRLYDCISAVVTEERNSIYELDFEYPVTGAHFEDIKIGRIVCVSHSTQMTQKAVRFGNALSDEDGDLLTDENGNRLTAFRDGSIIDYDVQPFDIVSYSRGIDGIVTFHCTHISYRQSYMTVTGSSINSLADAFTLLDSAVPYNLFSYSTDKDSTGYLAIADGTPKTVKSVLGGTEGSILDAYGGEYEWDKFSVMLHASRGIDRNFNIRYGVNMIDYNEELDNTDTYSSCVPYWKQDSTIVIGSRQVGAPTITDRGECVPLDVTSKFESQPTQAQVEAMGLSILNAESPMSARQTINVEFARLQDLGMEEFSNLYVCNLCDTINVVFPKYGTSAKFKIVKTEWNVLKDRYDSMELGSLSLTLSEALGIKKGK